MVDTKYEFGRDINGNIILIDELHTPDCSRYWIASSYTKRFENGEEPDNIDKDLIRKWYDIIVIKEKYYNIKNFF